MSTTSTSMRRFTLHLLLFAVVAHLSVMVTADLPGGIIQRKGTGFADQSGSPFPVQGANVYWLMYQGASSSSKKFVDAVYEDAQSLGLNVVRTWAFNDGGGDRSLQTAPGVYDESVFKALDYAVAEAAKHNIRLVMSLVNNYENYGGKPQYVKWARLHGQTMTNDDAFYTNILTRIWYKNHVKKVLSRVNSITGVAYKDDATIFAWELMNEPHCESDTSGDTLAVWVKEMAAYVKSIDEKHLLEIGLEGFYGRSTGDRRWVNPFNSDGLGTDFIRLNKIADIDYATVHSYPDLWIPQKTNDEKLTFLQIWVNMHIKDATNTLNMPLLFCEFGKSDRVSGYKPEMRQQFFWTMFNSIYSSITKGGAGAGSMLWQLLPRGMEAWNDGFGIFAKDSSVVSIIKTQNSRLTKYRASKSTDSKPKSRRRLLL